MCKGNNTKSYNHRHTHVTSFKQFHLIGARRKNAQFPMSHPIVRIDVLTKNLYKTVSTNVIMRFRKSKSLYPLVLETRFECL